MPYIKQENRPAFDQLIDQMHFREPGELNYVISRLCRKYLFEKSREIRYANLNEVMGVLACAQAEFYRRMAQPYEDEKARLNGDVF